MKGNESKYCMALMLEGIISFCQNYCSPRMSLDDLLKMTSNIWNQLEKDASNK